jgi:spermidine/putrescine transport system permease protein
MTKSSRIFLSVIYWAFVVYLFMPLALMTVMVFKD